jgi:hypothetical protein
MKGNEGKNHGWPRFDPYSWRAAPAMRAFTEVSTLRLNAAIGFVMVLAD